MYLCSGPGVETISNQRASTESAERTRVPGVAAVLRWEWIAFQAHCHRCDIGADAVGIAAPTLEKRILSDLEKKRPLPLQSIDAEGYIRAVPSHWTSNKDLPSWTEKPFKESVG